MPPQVVWVQPQAEPMTSCLDPLIDDGAVTGVSGRHMKSHDIEHSVCTAALSYSTPIRKLEYWIVCNIYGICEIKVESIFLISWLVILSTLTLCYRIINLKFGYGRHKSHPNLTVDCYPSIKSDYALCRVYPNFTSTKIWCHKKSIIFCYG